MHQKIETCLTGVCVGFAVVLTVGWLYILFTLIWSIVL